MGKRKKRPRKFHHFIYGFLSVIVRPIIYCKMAFRPKKERLHSTPSLIFANHVTDADPVLVGLALRTHMYYVSSAHIVHKGWGPLIMRLFDPILRVKGRREADATMEIIRRLKSGDNVCIFIEGERSYDGKTGYIAPTAAHLAKLCGFPLVNYRISGGYFSQPRWSAAWRKGHIGGEITGEYSAQQLRVMDQDDLQAQIEKDLYLDAYLEQRQQMIAYRGKALAENLETALFICPLCNQLASLHSAGDDFSCGCGLHLGYNEYGFFENKGTSEMPFDTVVDWFAWQKEKIKEICAKAQNDNATDKPLLYDDEQEFYVYTAKKRELYATGCLALYADRLVLAFTEQTADAPKREEVLSLGEVQSFSCLQQKTIVLTLADGRFYEISSPHARSAIKYQLFFGFLHGEKEKG